MLLGAILALPRQHVLLLRAAAHPLPRPAKTKQNFPLGRSPVIWSSSGAEPCSSRVVGGAVLVSLSSLSGPKRGCIWVSLGGAGPATDSEGEGGGDDSIFQVFGISGLRLVQPLTARCWAIADVLADPSPRGGRCRWGVP